MKRFLFSIRQAINLPAILAAGRVLSQPSKLRPNDRVFKLDEISIEKLKQMGIKAILFDKDNTLTLPYSSKWYDKRTEQFVSNCMKVWLNFVRLNLIGNKVEVTDVSWEGCNFVQLRGIVR
jgi:hypothetical protein